jgi:hypothetical protein
VQTTRRRRSCCNLYVKILAAVALLAVVAAGLWRVVTRTARIGRAVIRDPEDHTTMDADGAVRSIQAADITLPPEALEKLWSPENLERLARTYWRFLERATLGLIRVHYREDGRDVKAFGLIPLLTFEAPEYAMDADRGIVRWRIEKGILVSRPHEGYLEIDVRRLPNGLHVEVEVANFYPAIANRIGRWVYTNTQSRIHVIVTHAFLRSLARLDLAESKVGRFALIDEVPDPPRGDRHPERERLLSR